MTTLSRIRLISFCIFAYAAASAPLQAQLVIKLSPQTVTAFDRYANTVESSSNERWQGKKSFLYIGDDAQTRKLVLGGELFVKQMTSAPVEIPNGLIHDWLGAVYIPKTDLQRVLNILQDFDNHKQIYPEVADSKTIRRSRNEVTGYWRLQKKGLVPIILQVEQDAHYQQLSRQMEVSGVRAEDY